MTVESNSEFEKTYVESPFGTSSKDFPAFTYGHHFTVKGKMVSEATEKGIIKPMNVIEAEAYDKREWWAEVVSVGYNCNPALKPGMWVMVHNRHQNIADYDINGQMYHTMYETMITNVSLTKPE